MLPDWVSNPGPLTYESGALPIALRGPAPRVGLRGKELDQTHCKVFQQSFLKHSYLINHWQVPFHACNIIISYI